MEADVLCRLGEERVRQLCEAVSPAQRDVLLLRLVAGLTLEQVADLLGKSTGAIKALQCRGLTSLRAYLTRNCVTL